MSKFIGRKVKLVKAVRAVEGAHPMAKDCHAVGAVLTVVNVRTAGRWTLHCKDDVNTYDTYCLEQVRYLNNKKVEL